MNTLENKEDTQRNIMKTTILDLAGYGLEEVKELAKLEGYSLSTAYRSFCRKWMNVSVA